MKKLLLFVVVVLTTMTTTNLCAQVIDIIGVGTYGSSNATLTFTDHGTIDHVDLAALYKGAGVPTLTDVQFYDTDEGPTATWATDMIVKHHSGSYSQTLGHYDATFMSLDAGGVTASIIPTTKVHSFYGYVYRNDPTATYKSFLSPELVFMYRNSSNDPYVYNIPVETASSSRNMTVKIPITELDDTSRNAIIDITAGPVSRHIDINTYNFGNSFFLEEYLLENVPGNVDHVTVSIYSPDLSIDGERGDSFFVSGILVNADKVYDGCTLTQGYWRTHSIYDGDKKYDATWAELTDGENTPFFLSASTYYDVLWEQPKGNKYYILAQQYIAAELNFLNGADPSEVVDSFNRATELFEAYTPDEIAFLAKQKDKTSKEIVNEFTQLSTILDQYNNGLTGPGHCDETNNEERKIAAKFSVYPNPMRGNGTVKLEINTSESCRLELYNNKGMRVAVLYDSARDKLTASSELQFNTHGLKKGLYMLIMRNGSASYSSKIIIN